MAYTRILDETFAETENEKEDLYSLPTQTARQLLLHKTFYGVATFLWVVTTAILGWIILRNSESVENHAATLLPFSRGIETSNALQYRLS
jgi:hypothetical protein